MRGKNHSSVNLVNLLFQEKNTYKTMLPQFMMGERPSSVTCVTKNLLNQATLIPILEQFMPEGLNKSHLNVLFVSKPFPEMVIFRTTSNKSTKITPPKNVTNMKFAKTILHSKETSSNTLLQSMRKKSHTEFMKGSSHINAMLVISALQRN